MLVILILSGRKLLCGSFSILHILMLHGKEIETMTVEECYSIIGGSYEEAKSRLRDDARIAKFMGMFMRDQSFQTITAAIETQNYEEAFKGAHSLKGVCSNMAFTRLYEAVDALTEDLRGGHSSDNTMNFYEKTKELYQLVTQTITEFQNSQA